MAKTSKAFLDMIREDRQALRLIPYTDHVTSDTARLLEHKDTITLAKIRDK